MDRTRWRELASDYIEGTLPADTAEALRRHVASDSEAQEDEAVLRSVMRELNVLPQADPPLFFADNVVAAIERQGRKEPFWRAFLLPSVGRVAGGTLLTGGVVAALAWSLLLPTGDTGVSNIGSPTSLPAPSRFVATLLPGAAADEEEARPAPRLKIARVTTMLPDEGPAFDLSFWLEDAPSGTARFSLLNDKRPYRFTLTGRTTQTLRVPYRVARDAKTVDLFVRWTAEGGSYTKYLFVPVPGDSDVSAAPAPARQSFGLPEGTLLDTAREIATRYNKPVTIEDAPEDARLRLTARGETATEALRRNLSPLGLTATISQGGILITRRITPTTTADAPPATP